MKNIRLGLVALTLSVLTLIGFGSKAQGYDAIYAPVILAMTNTCPAQAATNLALVVPCGKQPSVTFQLFTQMDAAGTADMYYAFVRSVDGVTYDTLNGTVVRIPANGTTAVCICTNINTGGCGFIKLLWSSNAAATAVCTNLTVNWAAKVNTQ